MCNGLKKCNDMPRMRVLITLQDTPADEALALAEPALAKDWLNDKEDAAWAHLQPA